MASGKLAEWMKPETRSRRLLLALGLYVVCAVVFAVVAGGPRLTRHTQFNHYALLADAWLHGRQNILPHGGPGYAQGNDFADFDGKTYISFPPFPSVVMLPMVALAGSAEEFRDGQFMVWLAGIGPALMFLVLEKLRRTGRSPRDERTNLGLSALLAFGTVYFFTAVEGTVWFAAHVVGVACVAGYLLVAFDAEKPAVAGILLACAWATRPVTCLGGGLFVLEAIRVCCKDGVATEGTLLERAKATWERVDKQAFGRKMGLFFAPIALVLAICAWSNHSRFNTWNPNDFGHQFLTVAWRTRMHTWGLFGYHYLAKNLGVALTILPWLPPKTADSLNGAPFRINEHGLAIWFTMPFYFWLLWPKKTSWTYGICALSAILCAAMLLLYQNSGWRQFGYRFSNDYAPFLFIMLAVGERPFDRLFKAACVWGLVWNLFGAATFDHGEYDKYYWREGSQTILYQPDQ